MATHMEVETGTMMRAECSSRAIVDSLGGKGRLAFEWACGWQGMSCWSSGSLGMCGKFRPRHINKGIVPFRYLVEMMQDIAFRVAPIIEPGRL